MLRWKIFQSRAVAVAWLVFITVLFLLPGSSLPRDNWFTRVHFDKWAHTGVFAVLLFLWRSSFANDSKRLGLTLIFWATVYGFAIEFVQKYFVPNRGFDVFDVLFDVIGGCLGLLVWWLTYRKK